MDGAAFQPNAEFAFQSPGAGEQDEAAQVEQRNQQIQASFDQQRSQRSSAQNLSKALSGQAAEIAQLKQRQQQQKT
jgi:hypothetical protein